ncbi:hypothetical protein BUALT_Bualt13G0032200 [Buddleja alternifolia]|uniref:BHLH domain-containing protein n=1 Tax=Buddleja alternifolia TaxID=168488 RepID=A0AAV6WTH1_9LAMI|nr:hypothetical protein BUALT_Bualt13G0032200 [Buddleja alternifolia]
MNSRLTRYRSAPSSYFTSLLNTGGFAADEFDNLFNPRASSPETQRIFSRCGENFSSANSQFLAPIKSEIEFEPQQEQQQLRRQQSDDHDYTEMMFRSHNSDQALMDGSYNREMIDSMNTNPVEKMKMEGGFGGSSSTLGRHRSSPAGLFDNINLENEFGAVMRGLQGSSGAGNNANAEASFSSTSRFNKSHMMPPIPETRSKNIGEDSSLNVHFDEDIPGFPMNSWDDSTILSDSFLKGLAENDDKTFPNANTSDDHDQQNANEGGKRFTTRLSHHLSLPTSSSELSMEKLLQDSVPCKIRAKRGFATHPRSIAERVRRTKISDRIRKLQELVPNMEKQTNTSDMLDLAADYIKDLQRQVTTLSDNRAKCSCSARPKS